MSVILLLKMMGLSAILITLLWLILLKYRIPSLIDAYWPTGILILSLGFGLDTLTILPKQGQYLRYVQFLLVFLWALRLSLYIFWTRVKARHQDPRYQELEKTWDSISVGYFKNMQIQAFLQVGVASVFLYIPTVFLKINLLVYVLGFALAFAGFSIESIADWQLSKFKKNQSNAKIKHSVCNEGLWSLSRHPNYVGEWIFWIGISVMSYGINASLTHWISPILMYIILVYITGPMTEKVALDRKKDAFIAYQHSTPYFLPNLGIFWSKIIRGNQK